jgi:hypothetical protein
LYSKQLLIYTVPDSHAAEPDSHAAIKIKEEKDEGYFQPPAYRGPNMSQVIVTEKALSTTETGKKFCSTKSQALLMTPQIPYKL